MAGTMMKPPPTPMIAARNPNQDADRQGRDDADIQTRGAKLHPQRQGVDPAWWRLPDALGAGAAAGAQDRPHALDQHEAADDAEEDDIGKRDQEIDLAELRRSPKIQIPIAEPTSAAGEQDGAHRDVDAPRRKCDEHT